MDFTSDNAYGVAPQILAALSEVSAGTSPAYGDDEVTARLQAQFSELFERDVAMFLVGTGTAANSLALASLSPPYGVIFCHEHAHIHVDECAAPEFFTHGAKLLPLKGANGKLTPKILDEALFGYGRPGPHQPQPAAVSISQLSEAGTAYTVEEVGALSELAKARGLGLHMDGARFANAVASLKCAPADVTWRAGVDVLCFGATKNGAMAAEAVIFFDPDRAGDFLFRQKRAGQVFSKNRFIAAQMEAYLQDDLWLTLASQANAYTAQVAEIIETSRIGTLAYPVNGNQVFVYLAPDKISALHGAGAKFHPWPVPLKDGKQLCRFVTSYATDPTGIDEFAKVIADLT